MARTLPPLNALRAFEAAGRLCSFTRAAEELNVTHSAISRHVRGMEARLNVHLFRVRHSGVELTDQGRAYLEAITPALDRISEATEALTEQPEGTVTLTTEHTVAQKWLIPRLGALKALHPGIDLKISVTPGIRDIGAHEFDMGLRYVRGAPADDHTLVFPSQVRAYAAPGRVAMRDGAPDLAALAAGPLIQDATFRLWPEWFSRAGLDPVPELRLEHPLGAILAIQSAVGGLGPVLMDANLCGPERASGALEEIPGPEIPCGGYYLVVNARAGRRRAVRAVKRWILDGTGPA